MIDQPAQMAQLHQALLQAARQRLDQTTRPLAATDVSVVFTQPSSDPLQAVAQVTGGGRSVCFCEAELRDGTQRLVARAMGTVRYAG